MLENELPPQLPDPSSALFARIAKGESTAFEAYLDKYGSYVWTISRRFTRSPKDAEDLTAKIFSDLWNYNFCGDPIETQQDKMIYLIVLRRLFSRRLKQVP